MFAHQTGKSLFFKSFNQDNKGLDILSPFSYEDESKFSTTNVKAFKTYTSLVRYTISRPDRLSVVLYFSTVLFR